MSGNWAGCVLVGHWMGERGGGGFHLGAFVGLVNTHDANVN